MTFSIEVHSDSPLPLASQISEQLRWLIANGTLRPGDELPGTEELADLIGVNVHTVRAGYQQLASDGLISIGRGRRAQVFSLDRVRLAAKASLVRTHSVGVIVPEFRQPYARLVEGIEAEASDQKAMVFVANAHESSERALDCLGRFWAKGVDGIVVAAALINASHEVPSEGPPIVYIDSPGAPGVSVEFDLMNSQYLATKHLIDHGHQQIGFVSPAHDLANIRPKVSGHRKALHEANLPENEILTVVTDDFSVASGVEAGLRLLRLSDSPSAITTSADSLAAGIYRAAHQLGVRVPQDVAISSNDDSELADLLVPPLTTVTLPLETAGRLAVLRIRELERGDNPKVTTVLPVELVVRESCGCTGHSPGPN